VSAGRDSQQLPGVRAGDLDRHAAGQTLAAGHAQGCIDLDEFHRRLDAVFTATTLGDLDELTKDLPVDHVARRRVSGLRLPRWLTGWASWGVATGTMVFIDWANAPGDPFSEPFAYLLSPWPAVVAVPWAARILWRSSRRSRTS